MFLLCLVFILQAFHGFKNKIIGIRGVIGGKSPDDTFLIDDEPAETISGNAIARGGFALSIFKIEESDFFRIDYALRFHGPGFPEIYGQDVKFKLLRLRGQLLTTDKGLYTIGTVGIPKDEDGERMSAEEILRLDFAFTHHIF